MAKAGCTCNLGMLLVALVLMSIGVYFLVAAFATQLKATDVLSQQTAMAVLPWYFVGFLVVVLGKMAKWKSHGTCPVHGKMG